MKNTLLFTTLIAGLALAGCNKSTRTSTASNDPAVAPSTTTTTTTVPTTTDTVGAKIDRAGDRVADASRNAADNIRDAARDTGAAVRETGRDMSARMTEWRLSGTDLDADLAANRAIVRSRTSAGAPTGQIDKGTIEKAIKGRFHSEVPDLKIDANANAKGQVELEGKVRTSDQVAKAIAIALDTDGVTQVTSKIKLDPDAGPNRR